MTNPRIAWFATVAMAVVSVTDVRADVSIATVGAFSGQVSFRGEQLRQGADMAVAHINAQGGVLGHKVSLLVEDDACDAGQAVAVANKLVKNGVVFVAGHNCSGASIPASKVYEAAGILMISPASTNPRFTDEGGPNVFRVCGRDDYQGVVAGDYLADHWGDKPIAILHDGQAYGKGLAEATKKQLNRRGVHEALYESYAPGKRDYFEVVAKMRTAGVAVFYVGGYPTEAGLMLRQAHDEGYKVQLVAGDAITTAEFWFITGPAGEGTLMTFGPDARRNPEAADVIADFRARGYEPEGYTLNTYAAVQIWAQAVERAGSLHIGKVIEAMHSHEFDTVLGKIGFDQKGDITKPAFVWYVCKKGNFVLKE